MSDTVLSVEEVADRLGKETQVIAEAYLAEVADQANRCHVEPYNDSLAEALCRRVSRNLAMRNLPLGVVLDETGSTRIGSNDPEVRRLEGHYPEDACRMSIRTDIAEAASTVEGITGHPYVVGDTSPGTLYPRIDRIEYPNAFGGVLHLNVVLVLPQDLADAEQYLELKLPDLRAALEPHLVLTTVQPQRLQLDGVGILPVAFINGHREADLS